jgi:transglutaminase-like putative cysteine protease
VNLRLPVIAAIACMAASLSLHAVVAGNGWLGAGIGAVIVVFAAGLLTRLTSLPAVVATTFLALIAVVPLLTGTTWAGRIGGLVLVILAATGATGPRLLRAIATLLTYLASLLLYVNLVFASRASYGWIIPSRASMVALGQLTSAAFGEFKYSPPVGDLRGVSLVTGAGIGLVAIAVDILAVRLRRPAVAGLPLLLLFSVPVASNVKSFGAVQMVCFAAGLGGYLALLSADSRDRLRMWGRLVTFRHTQAADESGAAPDTRDLAASGRRIGLAAICLAVVVPLVLPSLHSRDVFGTTNDGRPGGTLVVSAKNPLALTQKALTGRPSPVLTYTTTAPAPHQQYLQQYVMNYDVAADEWATIQPAEVLAKQSDKLPFEVPGNPPPSVTIPVRTQILLADNETGEALLPVPYAPVSLQVNGSAWQEASDSLMLYNPGVSPAGLRYTVVSDEADPTAAQIGIGEAPNQIIQEYGAYNGPYSTQLQGIADRVTDGAGSPLQAALDLQNWFASSGTFTYTLKPNLPATHWLARFLTTDRRGLCTQFAQAFAVLARLVGIPSRVAVGYTAGTFKGGEWHVSTTDAHAWPELYFAGVGWLRFEPTPGGDGGQGTAYAPSYAGGSASSILPTSPGQNQVAPVTGPALGPGGKVAVNNRFTKEGLTGGSAAAASRAEATGLGFAIGIPVFLLLLVSWPVLARMLTRRRRWLAAHSDAGLAHAAWRELCDDLSDYGLSGSPGETPRAMTRRVAQAASLDPAAVQAVTRIGAAEERARYSLSAQPGRGLAADVLTVRRAVAASVPARQRLRARFWPASTIEAAGRLGQHAGDALRWLEAPLPALRRQVRSVSHRIG